MCVCVCICVYMYMYVLCLVCQRGPPKKVAEARHDKGAATPTNVITKQETTESGDVGNNVHERFDFVCGGLLLLRGGGGHYICLLVCVWVC